MISIDRRFSVDGVVLSAPIWLFMLGAACLIAWFGLREAMQVSHQKHLRDVVDEGYRSLGLGRDSSELKGASSAFEYPSFAVSVDTFLKRSVAMRVVASLPDAVKTGKRRGFFTGIALMVGIVVAIVIVSIVLPLVAEFLAVRYAVVHQEWSWLIVFVIIALVVSNVSALLVAASGGRELVREVRRDAVEVFVSALKSAGVVLPAEFLASLARLAGRPLDGSGASAEADAGSAAESGSS